jgi:LacI family transcriptional regulator
VAEVIGSTSYELVLYSINDTLRLSDKSDIIDHILASKLVAGLIAIFPGMQARHVVRLHNHGFPVVLIDDQFIPPGVPWVHSDNLTGAYTAVRHLIGLGHSRIAHIQGPAGYLCSRERYEGFQRAMQEAGLAIDPALTPAGDFTEVGGQAAARKLFDLPPEQRPTAIFSASDQTAFGVLTVAEEYGLKVPGDVALIGFDDIVLSAHVRPSLTSVHQPFPEMGRCAIELLLSQLDPRNFPSANRHLAEPPAANHNGSAKAPEAPDDPSATAPAPIQLATSLVVRASCGSSRGGTLEDSPEASHSAVLGTVWGATRSAPGDDLSEVAGEAAHDVSFSTPGLSL